MNSASGAGSAAPSRSAPAETTSTTRGWLDSLAAGFLAGALGGCVFLVVGLALRGADSMAYWPTAGYAGWLIVSSVGRYGLLFGISGLLLAILLHWPLGARCRWIFGLVLGVMASFTILAYLTAWWQIDVLAGLTIDDPARRHGAWLHTGIAGLAGLLVAIFTNLLKSSSRRRSPGVPMAVIGSVAAIGLIVASNLGLARATSRPTATDRQLADRRLATQWPKRVVVVGLDGMTFRVLSPLLRAGETPTFQRFVQEGAWGSFLTYGTASSPRVWTSMATGKRVRDHGISDFVQARGAGYRAAPMRSFDRKTRALWNILSDFGRRVGLVDWLITFPPEEVNGYIVSHLKLDANNRTFPAELEDELPLEGTRPAALRDSLLWDIDRAFATADHLLTKDSHANQPLDFLAVFDNSIDRVEHRHWKHYEPEKFTDPRWWKDPPQTAELAELIPDIYRALDRQLGELMATLSDDTLVLVVSDHGQLAAQRPRVRLRLDKILETLGYTERSTDAEGRERVVYRNSRAYTLVETPWTPVLRVNINLEGREHRGLVPREEAVAVADQLVDELRAVRFDDGRPLFSRVRRTRHPARSKGPGADIEVALSRAAKNIDLQVGDAMPPDASGKLLTVGGKSLPLADFQSLNPEISGDHDHQGVFLALGPGVRRGPLGPKVVPTALHDLFWHLTDKVDAIDRLLPLMRWMGLIERASTLDLTPTVLYTLGLPAARDMAGRPLRELFVDPPDLEWVDSYETLDPQRAADGEQTFDEEYLERLRSLGYVN